MRQCEMQHPSLSSASQDPCLHGIGTGLGDAYTDMLQEAVPEDWNRLIAQLDDRTNPSEQRQED